MTYLQLLQFLLMMVYLIIIFNCQQKRALTIFFLVNVTIFLFLFGNFFRKTYGKTSNSLELKCFIDTEKTDENKNLCNLKND